MAHFILVQAPSASSLRHRQIANDLNIGSKGSGLMSYLQGIARDYLDFTGSTMTSPELELGAWQSASWYLRQRNWFQMIRAPHV